MSNHQINTESNILSLVEMKASEDQVESPDSEELLIKSVNKGKIKDTSDTENKPPILNEKKSNSSLSFNIKANNEISYNVSKGKNAQKLFREPSSSVVSDIEGDPDNLSITTSNITDASDVNNMKNHQSPTQSLRNKRYSYNQPSTSNPIPWSAASSSNINAAASTSSNPNVPANPSTSSHTTNTNNNSGSNGHRPSLTSHGLSGSFVELINLTNNALAHNNNINSSSNNNNNNESAASPTSRHGSFSSNLQQNFYRLGLSDNINIETVDPSSTESGENQRPSQVGPGEAAWLLFRIYAIIKFIWSFVFSVLYFVHFLIKKSKSCDPKIYKFSIALTAVFVIQAISTLLLIIYLPTSITRYTNVVRRRVVISNRAWKVTAYTVVAEIVMVVIGAILIFDKDSKCSSPNNGVAYITITKVLIIIVVSFYTLVLLPFFIIPCACTFKLLPEYKGISDKVLKRFNSILYNPTEEVDEEDAPSCSICMENYKPGTRIKRLPCKHEFHPECITQWLETNNSCPICRQSFK